jgi:hypothetical protein
LFCLKEEALFLMTPNITKAIRQPDLADVFATIRTQGFIWLIGVAAYHSLSFQPSTKPMPKLHRATISGRSRPYS